MKKSILLIGMLSLFLSVVPAFGQGSETKCTAKVPFDFVVGSTVLPAGDYTFRDAGMSSSSCFVIQNKETGASALTYSRNILLSPTGSPARNGKWVFAHEGNRYVLHQVIVKGDDHVNDLIHGKEVPELPGTK
jgi:hypothetical protein